MKPRTVLVIAFAVMAAAVAAWLYQLQRGLVVTHLSNPHSWGLYVSALAFFVGNAAGGLVLSSSIYLLGVKELKPFARIGALTAFANVVAAMLSVIPDMGQPLRLPNILLHPQLSSPLVWDIAVLSAYALLSLVYLYVLMLPDLVDRASRLAIRVADPDTVSDRWARRLSPFALLFAISIHVVTAWIFSTQGAREFWFTAALAPDFVSVAVASGTAIVLGASILYYGANPRHAAGYAAMVRIITVAFVIHLFLFYNDVFIHVWYGKEATKHVLSVLFGERLLLHLAEVLLPVGAIVALWSPGVRGSGRGVVTAVVVLVAGVFAHRFLLMPPAFDASPLTFGPIGMPGESWSYPVASGRHVDGVDVFVTSWSYQPRPIEWLIFAGVVAFVIATVMLAVRHLPIVKRGSA